MDDKYKVKVLMLKGEKGEPGAKGEPGQSIKGDKGDPFTFDNLTDTQKQELMTNLSTYMKKEEGSLTVATGMTMIQTNITTYNDWSMLFVFANGIALNNDDYSIKLEGGSTYYLYLKESPKEPTTINWVCYNLIEITTEDYDKLSKGPKGDKGDKGDVGPQGPAGSIQIITNKSYSVNLAQSAESEFNFSYSGDYVPIEISSVAPSNTSVLSGYVSSYISHLLTNSDGTKTCYLKIINGTNATINDTVNVGVRLIKIQN